eukprot:388697-Rhodomonas_salina.2
MGRCWNMGAAMLMLGSGGQMSEAEGDEEGKMKTLYALGTCFSSSGSAPSILPLLFPKETMRVSKTNNCSLLCHAFSASPVLTWIEPPPANTSKQLSAMRRRSRLPWPWRRISGQNSPNEHVLGL